MAELKTRPPGDIERKVNGATGGAALGSVIVAAVMSWLPESADEIAVKDNPGVSTCNSSRCPFFMVIYTNQQP